ncbi:hypothetical protein QUF72_01370 [Desulfobacterales bacterium HSG2]|nr:hypothetical protein [Desulfobacterales bacterium HSG2]
MLHAPEICVEVLSDSNTDEEKKQPYFENGARGSLNLYEER